MINDPRPSTRFEADTENNRPFQCPFPPEGVSTVTLCDVAVPRAEDSLQTCPHSPGWLPPQPAAVTEQTQM